MQKIELLLDDKPEIVKAGICEHGFNKLEHHHITEWVFHLYNFSCSFECNKKVYTIIPGTVCLFAPGTDVTWTFPQKSCLIQYVHFTTGGEIPENQSISIVSPEAGVFLEFSKQLESIAAFYPVNVNRSEVELWYFLFKLTDCSNNPEPCIIGFNKSPIDIAITIIKSEFSQKLKIDDICRRSGASSSCLNRQCNEKYGMSLKEYLQWQRANKAYERLQNTRLPIRTIASDVSFQNLQQFNRFIHKHFSMSPKQIRELV